MTDRINAASNVDSWVGVAVTDSVGDTDVGMDVLVEMVSEGVAVT